ncbi:MAG: alpha/beta fold hydrolase [Planctomycetales bacterium]|nr:alpha/beta fold hydrolase [Planctomycetales bacterium]
MFDLGDASQDYDPLLRSFVAAWSSYLERSMKPGQESLAAGLEQLGERAGKRESFAVLGKTLDGYLRSREYLQAMKQLIDSLIQAKQTGASAPWDSYAQALEPEQLSVFERTVCTPHEVVYRHGTLQLLRFRRTQPSEFVEPVLICFALVNRPYILDLHERRSVVQQLLNRGFEVYLIDWGVPAATDCQLGLHDYICGLMKDAAAVVCEQSGSEQLNLLGYCMGGTMSTMYTSLYQAQVRNLILLAAPIDFSGDESLLNVWTQEQYFDADGLIAAYGNCPGLFLQFSFQLMKPATNFVEKYVAFAENLDNPAYLNNFLAMEQWSQDNIPIAGKTFLEFVKMLYRQNRLVQGDLRLAESPIRLAAITCPVLLLVAENDHLVPANSTRAIARHLSSAEVQTMSVDAGHIGLAVSSKSHQKLWPEATAWIADHSTQRKET